MRLTIQQGIDTHDLSQAIYETIRAGMEVDARAAQKRHQERMDLIRRSGEAHSRVPNGRSSRLCSIAGRFNH